MNVSQFNNGSIVSIWFYIAIAIPPTIASLLVIHFYPDLRRGLRSVNQKLYELGFLSSSNEIDFKVRAATREALEHGL